MLPYFAPRTNACVQSHSRFYPHSQCIDIWLDQQHVCPQCRHDLLWQNNNNQHHRRGALATIDIEPGLLASLVRPPSGIPTGATMLPMTSTLSVDPGTGDLSSFPPYTPSNDGAGGAGGFAPSPMSTSMFLPLRGLASEILPVGETRARGGTMSSSTGATIGTP